MQNPMQYSCHGNFHHMEHSNLGTFFFRKKKNDNRHVSFDFKYFKTHDKVTLSMFFVNRLPNSANLTIKIFQSLCMRGSE